MASMGVDPSTLGGNQIFVTLRKGKLWPPTTVDVRVKYEETIGDLKKKVEKKTGVLPEKQLALLDGKELKSDLYDKLTLNNLKLHTGFSLNGYDLNEEPDFWPAVVKTEQGYKIADREPVKMRTRQEMGYEDGLSMEEAIAKYREPGARW
eukprot:CAMPEP_0114252378 /NCGR_PEP_ID=MMETSP0058-20121206/15801_1 /TAXON_ID=36894 /ORGANISM="Pyramimonas parkeae, CCMP726" /LENGTH=149 /DNA_ID=CAMNT_0001366301 /DNA_START=92 /DNA_END=539 /DNA_ORIENTATION=+